MFSSTLYNYPESNQEFDSYLYYVHPVSVSSGNSVSNISSGTIGGSSAMIAGNCHGGSTVKQTVINNNQLSCHHSVANSQMITNSNLNINQQQQQHQFQQLQQHTNSVNQNNQSGQILQQQQQRVTNTETLQNNESLVQINPNTSENSEVPLIIVDENAPPQIGPTIAIAHIIKSILKFLAQYTSQPLWNYEDITAKG